MRLRRFSCPADLRTLRAQVEMIMLIGPGVTVLRSAQRGGTMADEQPQRGVKQRNKIVMSQY